MIRFVLARGHEYTVDPLTNENERSGPACAVLAYDRLFVERQVPAGAYVFCDLERLSEPELALASEAYRCLAASGPRARVLNDPAKVRTRYALLRRLFAAGFNEFDAYRADGLPRPARFPVFIRAEGSHDNKPLSALLRDQAELDHALEALVGAGRPLRGLIVIEYRAEPAAPGVFRRCGTYRLGDAMMFYESSVDDDWYVKQTKRGLDGEAELRLLDRQMRENHYAEPLREAFDLAGIEYGRADYGIVNGRPQVYEINTNPSLIPRFAKKHRLDFWQSALEFRQERFRQLLAMLDKPEEGRPIPLDGRLLTEYRRTHRWQEALWPRVRRFASRLPMAKVARPFIARYRSPARRTP